MNHHIAKTILLAIAILVSISLSFAQESKSAGSGETKAVSKSKSNDKSAKSAKAAEKLVDVNGAGKAELKTLPGIGDAEADKIIAGRPYGSKSHLTTHNVISRDLYEGLKDKVIARQKQTPAVKPAEAKKAG